MADREHRPYHEQVAATIIEALERGTAPWVHPWDPGLMPSPPVNALTGKPYRGVNQLWLSIQQYGYDKKTRVGARISRPNNWALRLKKAPAALWCSTGNRKSAD